jgi:hypothetical protein
LEQLLDETDSSYDQEKIQDTGPKRLRQTKTRKLACGQHLAAQFLKQCHLGLGQDFELQALQVDVFGEAPRIKYPSKSPWWF